MDGKKVHWAISSYSLASYKVLIFSVLFLKKFSCLDLKEASLDLIFPPLFSLAKTVSLTFALIGTFCYTTARTLGFGSADPSVLSSVDLFEMYLLPTFESSLL